jgi:prepilin-type processing-associated H-X9-DG protein
VAGIRNAGQTFLVADCGYAIITRWHAMKEPPIDLAKELGNDRTAYIPGLSINKGRDLWLSQMNDALKGRHPGKTINTGFVDGHLARIKAETFLVQPVESEEEPYPNLTPLWNPE